MVRVRTFDRMTYSATPLDNGQNAIFAARADHTSTNGGVMAVPAAHANAFLDGLEQLPAVREALGVALALITKHGLAIDLSAGHPEDYARLEAARAVYAPKREG